MLGGISKYAVDKVPALGALKSILVEQRDTLARIENRLAAASAEQKSELAELKSSIRQPTPVEALPHPAPASDEQSYRLVKTILQEAAIRNLPFLPHEIDIQGDRVEFAAWASAPNALFGSVKFFANGKELDRGNYPASDPGLTERLSEIDGAAVVRASGTLPAGNEKFVRLDQAANGRYDESDWRRAVHIMNPKFETYPFPPDANKLRVIGDTNETRFRMGGAMIYKNVEAYLRELGHTWSDFPSILDWGCGAGRVTRYLLSESGQSITGADIDSDNIAWCRENLTGGRFETIPLMPQTSFKDGEFDLAIGISVFTHLTETAQFAWLSELRRIIRPGGYALMSIQGPTQFAYNQFPAEVWLRLQKVGFVDLSVDPALQAVVEDQEYYRSTMHSRRYIAERWSEFFEVVEIVDAIAALQDFVVLRRR